jgi:chromosome segregation ATPase
MAKSNKKLAAEHFAANPSENQLYIFKDGEVFFSEVKAQAYKEKYKLDEDPEIFFRGGVSDEPVEVDTTAFTNKISEQAATIKTLEEANVTLKTKLAEERTTSEKLTIKVNELEADNKTFSLGLDTAREAALKLGDEATALKAEKDKLTGELTSVKSELAKLQKTLKTDGKDQNPG